MRYCLILLAVILVSCSKAPTNPVGTPNAVAGTQSTTNPKSTDFSKTFTGAIDDKYPIKMTLQRTGSELSGTYQYVKYKKDIQLKGTIDGENNIILHALDSYGNPTETFKGAFTADNEITFLWLRIDNTQGLPLILKEGDQAASVNPPAQNSTPDPKEDFSEEGDETSPNPGLSGLDAEAVNQVKNVFESSYFTKCGESYFSNDGILGASGIAQRKNPTYQVTKKFPINDADRLNGITWKGHVLMRYEALRLYRGSWSDWRPYEALAIYGLDVEKRNTGWRIGSTYLLNAAIGKISCSNVPK